MWVSRKKLNELQNKIATLDKEQRELLSIIKKHIGDETIETRELKEILFHIKGVADTYLVEQFPQRGDTH